MNSKTPEPSATIRELRIAREGRKGTAKRVKGPRDGRTDRIPDPNIVVLFGATGDLAHRKVVPALYHLWMSKLLPENFALLCFGRRANTDEALRAEYRASLELHARLKPVNEAAWSAFAGRISYLQGAFDDPASYAMLSDRLNSIDAAAGTAGNRLFYLATPASAVPEIVRGLGGAGLDHESADGGWRRIVVEKPFGRDVASAVKLNREIGKVFRESQIYRIDHYLGKETVRNILIFRFGNLIFEPLWHRLYIDHVQITVAESIGVEARGDFYEQTGALRDVLQNHLLQLLALVAMEPPATLEADALRDEKVKVLRAIRRLSPVEVERSVVRGQYGPGSVAGAQAAGYHSEPEVDAQSETETYVAARFEIDDWRWSGVPFYLRAGKRMAKRATEIAIQFKAVPQELFGAATGDADSNLLVIRIQPDEGIMLRFAAKVPGLGVDVRPVNMDFGYGSSFGGDVPEAYETLILDALLGDASLFTRADEVEEAWRIVDPIIDAWVAGTPPRFPNYASGSWGPDEADELLTRDGHRWRNL